MEGRGTKLYMWAKFHDYYSYSFGTVHVFMDGWTDTILEGMAEVRGRG